MADAFSNTTSLDDAQVAALIDDYIATAARGRVVAAGRFTLKNLDPDSGAMGHTFANFGALVATAIAEDTGQESVAASTDGVTITASGVGVTIKLTKQARIGGISSLTDQILREMGAAVAAKMDQDTLALAAGFSAGAGASGTDLDMTAIIAAKQTLGAAKPIYGYFGDTPEGGEVPSALTGPMAFIDHVGKGDLDKSMITAGASFLADPLAQQVLHSNGAAPNGYVGSLFGVPVFVSDNVHQSAGDRVGLLATPSAIGVVVKRLAEFDREKNVQARLEVLAVDSFYGVGEVLDRCGVKLTYGAT